MSAIENMLHVLRMPADMEQRPTDLTQWAFYAFVTAVVLTAGIVVIGFHRWII